MAHFAELDSSGKVLRVIVISNEEVDDNGGDKSSQAETFVASIVPYGTGGTAWKQTSYNHKFRKQYASEDCTYDSTKDKFITIKPFASWSLNASDDWIAPVTYPTVTDISSTPVAITWDEDNRKWLGVHDSKNYEWNASSTAWDEV